MLEHRGNVSVSGPAVRPSRRHPLFLAAAALGLVLSAAHAYAAQDGSAPPPPAASAQLDGVTFDLPRQGAGEAAAGEGQATPMVTAVYGPPGSSRNVMIGEQVLERPPGVPDPLLDLVGQAIGTHPAIRTAEAELRAARSDVEGARWLRFPSLDVQALAATRGSTNASRDFFAPNLTIDQPLWDAGRINATVDRARAAQLVRGAAIEEGIRDIALRTVQAYYDIALSARQQAILQDGLEQHRILLETISNRVEQEISPRSDLSLAESRTAQIEQQLASARSQGIAAFYRLAELTGIDSPDLGTVPPYDPAVHHPSTAGVVERALACDPTIARARAQVRVAEADYRSAKAQIYPQVSAQLSQNEITGTRFGLAVRAQTGGGLSRFSAATAARTRIEGTEFEISTAERQLREELRSDFVLNETAGTLVMAGLTASDSAGEVTDSYRRQFIAGRRTWLDVMNAVREATSSELNVAESEVAAMASTARIWLRSCGWAPEPADDAAAAAADTAFIPTAAGTGASVESDPAR